MTTAIDLDLAIAKKVLAVVDAGLSEGVGKPEPGFMCVEAAVCYALGLPHGDEPECVSSALRSLKIALNDKPWSSKKARAKGLRRLALAQLGSRGALDDREFAKRVAELAIRKFKAGLLEAAYRCEAAGTRDAASYAAAADYASYAASYAAAAAAYATKATSYATATAAAAAAAAAAAYAAAYADYAAAYAAAYAAYAAADADAAKKKAYDEVLSGFAEGVVQILIGMRAPGCQWLSLTESQP